MPQLGGNTLNGRVHLPAHKWATEPGTDFWLMSYSNGYLTATNAHELADYGWTTTGLAYSVSTGGDFLSFADSSSYPLIVLADATDLLLSPSMFGGYWDGQVVAEALGYTPTSLSMECVAIFTTHSADENITGFGFSTGTSLTDTLHVAFINTNGTVFQMRNGAGVEDDGQADDALYHRFKITLSSSTEWFIDGTSQGSQANATDGFPTAFSASATTTNEFGLGWVHISYR